MCSIGPTFPVTIQTLKLQPAYIDLIAIVVDTTDGISIRVSVLNRHPTADWKADFRLDAFGKPCLSPFAYPYPPSCHQREGPS
jgi:hypothetical protein